jgi:hypothetical protein
VVAFTGTEYLVWSGEAGANDVSQRADGFAVDVTTGAVRPIPIAPIDPRSGATGVWTGTSLIVCCGTGEADGFSVDTQSAASWDPATDAWRRLARPPASIARSYATSVWTGGLMVVMAIGPAVAVYDPVEDRWTEAVTPPTIGRGPEAVWTGEEVVLWDSVYGSGMPDAGGIADRGWRWAPGDEAWAPLPPLPEGARTQMGSMAWTGTDVVVWGQSTSDEAVGTGARWRPGADEWRPVAPSPQGPVPDPYNGTPGSQALASDLDGRVVVRGIEGGDADSDVVYLYDAASDRWTTTPVRVSGFHPSIHLIGGRVFVPDESSPIAGAVAP